MLNLIYIITIHMVVLHSDSVQKSLEAKFENGKPGTIPIELSPAFKKQIAVSLNVSPLCIYCSICIGLTLNPSSYFLFALLWFWFAQDASEEDIVKSGLEWAMEKSAEVMNDHISYIHYNYVVN